MATSSQNDDIDVTSEIESEGGRKGPSRRGLFILAALIAVIAYLALSGGAEDIQPDLPEENAENQDDSDRRASERALRIGGPTRQAALGALDNKIAENARAMEELRKTVRKGDQETLEAANAIRREVTQQLSEISAAIIDSDYEAALNDRNVAVDESGGAEDAVVPDSSLDYPPSDTARLPGFDGQDQEVTVRRRRKEPKEPDPFEGYQRLSGSSAGTSAQSATPTSFVPSLEIEDDATQDNGNVEETPDQSADEETEPKEPSLLERATQSGPRLRAETLPAFSAVEITNLHGASCPISGGGSLSEGDNRGVPVVFPVVGEFFGPNGKTRNIGKAHLMGLCIGQDTPRPTAIIKIERLSYVASEGEPQFIPINGFVIDRRDNNSGIEGIKESVRGRQIAALVASATAEGFAEGLEANQENTVEDLTDGSVFSSVRNGRGPQRAAASGAAGGLKAATQYFSQRAAESFAVISFPAGLPLNFVTLSPTEYLVPDVSTLEARNDGVEPLL